MTTEDFAAAARAEAKDRWWNGAVPKDVNPPEAWILGFQEGALWARTYLAEQEPTDDAVCDLIEDRMCDAMFTACVQEPDGEMTTYVDAPMDEVIRVVRDALAAAQEPTAAEVEAAALGELAHLQGYDLAGEEDRAEVLAWWAGMDGEVRASRLDTARAALTAAKEATR